MKNNRFFTFLAVLILPVAFFMACDEDDDSPSSPSNAKANVMAIHASPDAPAVDIVVDGATADAGLMFPSNTGYVEVGEGTRNVKVNVSGTNPAVTVLELSVPVGANKSYSIFAIDSVANISVLALEDNLAAPAAGNAHVRFIHLSPNAPNVDITDTSGNIIFGDIEFVENTEFTPLPAASYDLQVRVAGTAAVALELPGITLEDGKIYTIFAKGFLGGAAAQELGAEIIVNN